MRRPPAVAIGICAVTLAAVACLAAAEEQPRSLQLAVIDPPAAPGATSPAIATEAATTAAKGHDVLMTWLEPEGRLRFARYSAQAWTPAITIAEGVSTLDPKDRPSLTVLDTQAVRRTLIARTGDVVARTGDAGRTWTRLPAPPLPFASFAGGDEGGYAFWLDGDGSGSAKLLGSRILTGETVLDPQAADGSSTSAAMTWDGPIVVYREGSTEAAEDVVIVRRQDAAWTRPRPIHHVAGWHPARTPKSGPEVAVVQRQVAVAWYSEAPHRPRVLVAFSSDAGRTFGTPIEVDVKEADRAPLAFVDVALDDAGHALVLWLAATEPTAADLHLARVSADGRRADGLVLATGLDVHSAGMPQISRAGANAAVTWIEGAGSAPGRLRAVTVPFDSIPAPGNSRPGPVAAAPDSPTETDSDLSRLGELIADLELVSLDDAAVSLASLRGRAVLLNLWATWCLPCIAEMPELAALHARYGAQGLVVVGLSVDAADAEGKVYAFVAERQIRFAIWLDPEMRLYGALRVKSLPVTLVLDREGQTLWRRDGTIKADDPELEEALSRALSDS